MSSKKIDQRFDFLRIIVALVIAVALAFVAIVLVSKDPLDALSKFVTGPLSSIGRVGNVIELMIPLIFTGCAVCIMQQGGQFSMIMEGAFFFGGAATTFVVTENFAWPLPAGISTVVAILFAGIVGGLLAFIPAIMKYKWGANEVVASIMLNYILLYFSNYLLNFHFKEASQGFLASHKIVDGAKLMKIVPGTRIHMGLFIAIGVIIFSYFFLYRTKWGYAIRMTGKNASFARYSGIAVGTVILYSQILGGFISGMGGSVQLLGIFDRLNWATLPGYGFDGIVIAMICNRNPLGVPLGALFLAYLRTGADIMTRTTDIPTEIVNVVQGIVILLVGAKMFLEGWRHKAIVKNAEKELLVAKEAE